MAADEPLPIAGLVQGRGDWEWLVQNFRFRHCGAEQFCYLCDATQSGAMWFLDFRRDAPHRGTLITNQAYLLACAREGVVPQPHLSVPRDVLATHWHRLDARRGPRSLPGRHWELALGLCAPPLLSQRARRSPCPERVRVRLRVCVCVCMCTPPLLS